MPDSPTPAHQQIAAALLGAQHVVVLTGWLFGLYDEDAIQATRTTWSQDANLEVLLTDPAAFWRATLPAAATMATREITPAHRALTRLQHAGIIEHLITQSVDHRQTISGAHDVIEVHGNLLTARCTRCGERYGLEEVRALIDAAADAVPRCTARECAYPLRPSSTLWGEPLIEDAVRTAWEVTTAADCFVVIDSDLRAVPMSLLPSVPLTRGVPLIMLGETPTQYDRYASVLVREPSDPVLVALANLVGGDEVTEPDLPK
jgi:NAD-dependent deacetylase